MTYVEAHKYIEDLQREFTTHRQAYSKELIEANGKAIEALEKQIPKKPLDALQVTEKEFMFICPNCELATSAFHGYKILYCPKCGQALDWSDEK